MAFRLRLVFKLVSELQIIYNKNTLFYLNSNDQYNLLR